ncbi:LLM class flavin-dependent oxidoreductase [Curtobacterium flaccumfaciens pv. flaccumfaciens]|uniref:LLM class flavin-dependent oxidoreductase n=1 Tax=Curtobacterium flaccumfaciens pv. flaccumfaciens TaxID=138532 RepID=A0A9Q2W4S3_9MICO|nr:LLM class flavin-dependent oxidoreductase [Curtobacterium flaccumfaciens]MBT1542786.1 LLM class flavin-dependent oxidoreductase [Curtobacterium flaccumfaciens pv. flaccumfaciens]MBT1620258.1 LLM class flavin-dependent oxidoreductase [Curtobacterium flaccumfaciens pv. poinsettiae]
MDMTKIGFLSFGHWRDVPGSKVRSGREALVQAIDLAVAAEEAGVDGAYFRVHHFAPQQAAPFPLLAAIAAKTSRIEIGTGVIDMRYENPLYMAEEAAATDLISGGRLQLGVSRGSPETALAGYQQFGYVPDASDENGGDMARAHTSVFRRAIAGEPMANANPQMTGSVGSLPISPLSDSLGDRIWWGAGTRATAEWTAEQGMNLMSSTLLTEDTGVPFDQLQAEQIERFRRVWAESGWERTPRVSVSRSIIPIIDDESRHYFGIRAQVEGQDQVGHLDGGLARFGRSYIGEPEQLVAELAADQAVRAADTVLVTVPNQLGVEFNARLLAAVKDVFTEVDAEPVPA